MWVLLRGKGHEGVEQVNDMGGATGRDEADERVAVTHKAKLVAMAQELMWDQDLTPKEVLAVVERVFGAEKARTGSYYLLLDGFHRAFRSDIPFVTASIYFRNIRKVFPNVDHSLSTTTIRMFKNMVMEMGNTGIALRSDAEYRAAQQSYYEAFGIYPPKSANVFAVLVQDRRCRTKLLQHPDFFTRVVDIFSFVDPLGVQELREDLLAEYQRELDRLTEVVDANEEGAVSAGSRIDEIRRRMAVLHVSVRAQ